MTKLRLRHGLIISLCLLLSACASQPRQGMYWGSYESSYYELENTPGDQARQRHIDTLRNIVAVSDSRGWPPPPGTLLELANYERQLGNQQTYAYYVNRERQLYPESNLFIRRWFADVVPPVVVPEPVVTDENDKPAGPATDQNATEEQANDPS
ncbi:DUF4810 domain-containing protein [Aliidiomarina soli]|uniref:DUF4810 domain-containing protein n=1 Tax=Aliidiomarina soli TaxID=1928574 RepID=A0A432WJM9_9GAMM|nr:DUF4810 domain-containing protein [Aliidiomarina soli]RUO33907.1 hypothetical protein CWE14_05480 [Aliidiomarina soli]